MRDGTASSVGRGWSLLLHLGGMVFSPSEVGSFLLGFSPSEDGTCGVGIIPGVLFGVTLPWTRGAFRILAVLVGVVEEGFGAWVVVFKRSVVDSKILARFERASNATR